jgi:hypothetical protein
MMIFLSSCISASASPRTDKKKRTLTHVRSTICELVTSLCILKVLQSVSFFLESKKVSKNSKHWSNRDRTEQHNKDCSAEQF